MNNFLVLGLPRSRTAWLSNFLTYGDVTCTHEGLNGCNTLQEYKEKFTNRSGDSNTGLALFDFEEQFLDFKTIIIDNTIDASVKFAKEHYGADVAYTMNTLKDRLSSLDGLHVQYNDINNQLQEIWDYVSNDQFNEKRATSLINFDIQIMKPYHMDHQAMFELRKNTNAYF